MKVKHIVYWMVCCICLLSACVAEDLQNPVAGDGEGYLSLRLSTISADISSATVTKGKLTNVPSENEFTIDLKKEGTSVPGFPMSYSSLPSSMVLPIGEYTIETYNTTTNDPIQESAYFYGSSTVKVLPNQDNSGSVEAKLANALLTPIVSDDLRKHYTNWELSVSAGTGSIELANQSEIKTLYAKAGQRVTFTFEGTNLTGQKTITNWQMPNPVMECTEYKIQCDPNLSVFSQIQVIAKATHTYDSSDYLNGTDVMLKCNLNEANAEAIQTWNVQVMYNGTAIRTYSGSTPNNLPMTQTEGWPYIPQGSTLSASVTLKTEDEIQLTNSSFSSLPLPIFGISVSGETSYSVYKQSGASEANQKDGSSIFNIGSTVKISEGILNNPNYANMLPKVTYTTDTGQNSGESAYNAPVSDFSGLNWQKHVLTATASFDGVTVSNSQDCHVTGLPYYKDFHDANLEGWTGNGNYESFSSGDFLGFKPKDAWILSPQFYVPENKLDILISLPVYSYTGNRMTSCKPTLYIDVSNKETKSGYEKQFKGNDTTPPNATFETITSSFSFLSNISQLCIYVYSNESILDPLRHFVFKNCSINYN